MQRLLGFAITCLVTGVTACAGLPNGGQREHQPPPPDAELAEGELEPPPSRAYEIAKRDRDPVVMAIWTDAEGGEEMFRIRSIEISGDVMKACGVSQAVAFFDSGSAQLTRGARRVLDTLGRCFTSGPLTDQPVELVGHGDPEGTGAANERLGLARAQSVADFLVAAGVARERIVVRTAGEQTAHEDPQFWPIDRRVDIGLAPVE